MKLNILSSIVKKVFSKVWLATIGEIVLYFRLILSVNRHVQLFSQSNWSFDLVKAFTNYEDTERSI